MAEPSTVNRVVVGSSPTRGAMILQKTGSVGLFLYPDLSGLLARRPMEHFDVINVADGKALWSFSAGGIPVHGNSSIDILKRSMRNSSNCMYIYRPCRSY